MILDNLIIDALLEHYYRHGYKLFHKGFPVTFMKKPRDGKLQVETQGGGFLYNAGDKADIVVYKELDVLDILGFE